MSLIGVESCLLSVIKFFVVICSNNHGDDEGHGGCRYRPARCVSSNGPARGVQFFYPADLIGGVRFGCFRMGWFYQRGKGFETRSKATLGQACAGSTS